VSRAVIEALRSQAATAGDLKMVAVCDAALRGQAVAIKECQRVIAYAAMRADE